VAIVRYGPPLRHLRRLPWPAPGSPRRRPKTGSLATCVTPVSLTPARRRGRRLPDRNAFSARPGTGLRTTRKPAFHDRGRSVANLVMNQPRSLAPRGRWLAGPSRGSHWPRLPRPGAL